MSFSQRWIRASIAASHGRFVAMPTLTKWLMILGRAYSQGSKTLAVEVLSHTTNGTDVLPVDSGWTVIASFKKLSQNSVQRPQPRSLSSVRLKNANGQTALITGNTSLNESKIMRTAFETVCKTLGYCVGIYVLCLVRVPEMRPDLKPAVRAVGEYISGLYPEQKVSKVESPAKIEGIERLVHELSQTPRN